MDDIHVSVESADGLSRRLRISVPSARIEREVEERLRSLGQTARIAGYRPGKIPVSVLRHQFGTPVRQEIVQNAVQASCSEAIAREQLNPACEPAIEIQTDKPGNDLTYTATFDVYPEAVLTGIAQIRADRPEPRTAESDVDGDTEFVIEGLRRQRIQWPAVTRPSRYGDRLTVNYAVSLHGQSLPAEGRQNVVVMPGSGQMFADFEGKLIGLEAGATAEFALPLPANYTNAALAGRNVTFSVNVVEVAEERLPDVDPDFIRGFGVPSGDMAEFRRDIRMTMEQDFAARARAELRRQLLVALARANPIPVPASMIEKEAALLQTQAQRNAATAPPTIEALRPEAESRVRLTLLIGMILREQQINVDAERVRARIDEIAANEERPDEIRKIYLQTPQLLSEVEHAVLEEQVVDWLASQATVTPRAMSFRELVEVSAGR